MTLKRKKKMMIMIIFISKPLPTYKNLFYTNMDNVAVTKNMTQLWMLSVIGQLKQLCMDDKYICFIKVIYT
jgi:hypothetical protein